MLPILRMYVDYIAVPDAVETCEAVRAYNEGTLDHIELKWTSLMVCNIHTQAAASN